MSYGKEYGAGSSDCSRCEAHGRITIVECYECGAYGCDRCFSLQQDSADPQTGYIDERYVCSICESKVVAEAAEMHAENWRVEALARCADLRESLRQAEGAD